MVCKNDPIYHGMVKLVTRKWATEVKRGRWLQLPMEVVKQINHGMPGDWFMIDYIWYKKNDKKWRDIVGLKLEISTEPRNIRNRR